MTAIVALVLVASVTGNRIVAIGAGAVVLLTCSVGLLRVTVKGISSHQAVRRWLPIAITAVSFLFLSVVVGSLLFGATPSYIPLIATPDIQYWDLPTGSRIAYTYLPAQGEPKSTPVLLVHGGPGSPDTQQEPLKLALSQAGFDVYGYHQVGAGLSERLDDVSEYTVDRHVRDLEAIRQTIGAEEIVLVGGSWGGQLIASYITAHPDRVGQAVVSSPGAIWAPAYNDESRLTPQGIQDQQDALADYPRFVLAHLLLQTSGPKGAHALFPDSQMDGVFQAFVGDLDMWAGCPDKQNPNVVEVSAETPKGVGFWVNAVTTNSAQEVADPRPALRSATMPVLVLRGECDYIAWEVTREYRDIFPNAVLLPIDNAGHTIHTQQPERYLQAVVAFLLGEPLPQPPYTAASAPW